MRVPEGVEPGNWFLTPWIDPYDAVLEDTLTTNINPDDPNQLDNNNYKARPLAVLATTPSSLAVDSRGDIYVGEVSFTNWGNRYKGQPHPPGLRSLQKLVKVR